MLQMTKERKQRGWSQAELARRAKMHSSDISKIEAGLAKPYPGQRTKLARALKMHGDALLMDVDG